MIALFHGEAGGWDELLIALVAFGVLWIAVKLAGRKGVADGDDDETVIDTPAVDAEEGPAHPPAAKLG